MLFCMITSYLLSLKIYQDPRVEDWPFMGSPLPTLELCLIYILIVKILGPAFMRDRPAFKLRRTLLIYNFAQIVLSCYIFYQVCAIFSFLNQGKCIHYFFFFHELIRVWLMVGLAITVSAASQLTTATIQWLLL